MADRVFQNQNRIFVTPINSPKLDPEIPIISSDEIEHSDNFVTRGGGLILMANSYYKTEEFEQVQFRKLFNRFGLDWNDDNTKYVDIIIGTEYSYFCDVDVSHCGVGSTINYQKFDEPEPLPEKHEIIVKTNRLGSIADIIVSDVSLIKLPRIWFCSSHLFRMMRFALEIVGKRLCICQFHQCAALIFLA